jgi:serine/threonine protein kinase
LDEARAGDPALRREVAQLLAADEQSRGLQENPAVDLGVSINQKTGPHRIEGKLGQGEMGIVFRAHDTELNRSVALKLLSDDAAAADARRVSSGKPKPRHPSISLTFSPFMMPGSRKTGNTLSDDIPAGTAQGGA